MVYANCKCFLQFAAPRSRTAIGNVVKKLNAISVTIHTEHTTPFPKPDCFLLSHYRYERRYIKIDPCGRIVGGLPRMISSLIDCFLGSFGMPGLFCLVITDYHGLLCL